MIKEKENRQLVLMGRLDSLKNLSNGWDGDGSLAPSVISIANARQALEVLANHAFLPQWANPIADGGIEFVFKKSSSLAAFDFYNNGDVVIGVSCGGKVVSVWQTLLGATEIKESIDRVKNLIK